VIARYGPSSYPQVWLKLSATSSTAYAQLYGGDFIYDRNLVAYRSSAYYTGYIYVPLTTALTNSGLDGDALAVGTYSIGPVGSGANFEFNYPSAARALSVRLSGRWSAANGGYYCYLRPSGSTGRAHVVVHSLVANIYNDNPGIVGTDTNGKVELVVVGANTTGTWVVITGYFL